MIALPRSRAEWADDITGWETAKRYFPSWCREYRVLRAELGRRAAVQMLIARVPR